MRETVYLAQWLEVSGVSQVKLHEKSGLYATHLSKICKTGICYTDTRVRIEKALGLKPGDLRRNPIKGIDIGDWINDPNATIGGKNVPRDLKDAVRKILGLTTEKRKKPYGGSQA